MFGKKTPMSDQELESFVKVKGQDFGYRVARKSIIIDREARTVEFDRIRKDGSIEHHSLIPLENIEGVTEASGDTKID